MTVAYLRPWVNEVSAFYVQLCCSLVLFGAQASAAGKAAPAEQREFGAGSALPSLGVVLEQARRHAPQVQVGEAALAVSRTEMVNARRIPIGNPYFEIVGQQGTRETTRGTPWGVTAWLPFEMFGQRGRRVAEANAYQQLFETELTVAQASALGEAYEAFGATHVEGERIRIVEQMVEIAGRTAQIYEARLASGDAVLRDATMAKVEVARNQVLLQAVQGRFVSAITRLSQVTGRRYTRVDERQLLVPSIAFEDYVTRLSPRLAPVVSSAEAEAKFFDAQRERFESETLGPLSLMLLGGRGDLGEARVGAGIAYEVPVTRSRQGEKARASSEAMRARTQQTVAQRVIKRRIEGIVQQYRYEQSAYELLTDVALPAAERAVASATATLEAGKTDWFAVLLSRRDLMTLSLERLDVVGRQWSLLGELIQLTGELP